METALRARARIALLLWALAVSSACRMRGAQMPQSPLLRVFERPAGLIAYVAPDGNIGLVDQKAGGGVRITSDASTTEQTGTRYGIPTWAPDGRALVFPGYRAGPAPAALTSWVVVADRKGRESARLYTSTELRPIYLSWSPDSRRISILSATSDGALELGVASARGDERYRALDTGQPYYWVWHPDSRRLISHVGQDRMSLLSAERAGSRESLPAAAPLFQSPDVSRDGARLAYARPAAEGHALVIRTLATGMERVVTTGPQPVYFALSRDATRVAVLRADAVSPIPHGSLTLHGLEEGREAASPSVLASELALAFFWSPSGRRLAYLTVAEDPSSTDGMFRRSRDLLYVRLHVHEPSRKQGWVIAQYPLTSGLAQLLPFFDQYLRSITIWSPDERNLVFTAYASDGRPAVFVAPADGNFRPRALVPGDAATWSPER